MWPMSTCGTRSLAAGGYPSGMTAGRYHHGNLRAALVDEALAVARERGPEGLVLRDLARRVGVSHNAAYRHFADREAIVDEVALVALAGLSAAMSARLDEVEGELAATGDADPVLRARRRLIAIGHGYADWALVEPGLFRVLFTAYPEVPESDPAVADPYAMLNDALDDLVAVGSLGAARRPGAEVTCWSAVHGFSVLCIDGPLRALPPDEREAALLAMLDSLDRAHQG